MKLKVCSHEVHYADGKTVFNAVSLVSTLEVELRGLRKAQIASSAPDAIKKLPEALRDELLLIGAIAVASAYASEHKARHRRFLETDVGRARAASDPTQRSSRSHAMRAIHAAKKEKIRAFDRIIEMLDHHKVNGIPLGDCRRADLLRAATENLATADDLTVHAALYKQLAGMIGNGTVREYRDRAGIVALLTTTFEAAAL